MRPLSLVGTRLERLRHGLAPLAATLAGALVLGVAPAHADFGFQDFSAMVQNADGSVNSQAGAHPFSQTLSFTMNDNGNGGMHASLEPKNIAIDFPAGFSGSATATPACAIAQLQYGPGCPTDSQVGVAQVFVNQGGGPFSFGQVPVYNMAPESGSPAELAFVVLAKPLLQPSTVKVRGGDYGLTVAISNIAEYVPVAGATLTLWGIPADSRHDAQRFLPSMGGGFGTPGDASGNPLPSGSPALPFLVNPTHCGTDPLEAKITGEPWSHPGQLVTRSSPMYPAGIGGCDKLGFDPSVQITTENARPDAPSGYSIDLTVPDAE